MGVEGGLWDTFFDEEGGEFGWGADDLNRGLACNFAERKERDGKLTGSAIVSSFESGNES